MTADPLFTMWLVLWGGVESTFRPPFAAASVGTTPASARCVARRGLSERCGRGAFSSREAVDVAHRRRWHSRGCLPAYLVGRCARRVPRFPVRRPATAASAAGKLLRRAAAHVVDQAGTGGDAGGGRRR